VLLTFTLDSNCLTDIEESRPAAPEVRALAGAHTAGTADVAVIAMSASERPKPGHSVNNFFEDRLVALGLAHLNIVLPMLYWDISFWDHGLWADDAMVDLERRIHSILFPNVQFLWQDYCRENGINPPPDTSPSGKWRNCKCDVQAIWSHIHSKRNVCVTSDTNFHKRKSDLISVGAGQIEYPDRAAKLI
jgi:hypothetical protein